MNTWEDSVLSLEHALSFLPQDPERTVHVDAWKASLREMLPRRRNSDGTASPVSAAEVDAIAHAAVAAGAVEVTADRVQRASGNTES
jgi:hypothetical protein